jgi:hypothetical protein
MCAPASTMIVPRSRESTVASTVPGTCCWSGLVRLRIVDQPAKGSRQIGRAPGSS